MKQQLGVLLFLSVLFSSSLVAQDSLKVKKDYSAYKDQPFEISPFFWLLGLQGEIIAPPRPTNYPIPVPPRFDIDVGFKDIQNSIKFFIMLGTEYEANNFVVAANVTSLVLEGDAITPLGLITEGIRYDFTYLTSEITGGYRFIKTKKLNLNGMLGVRMLYTNIGASSNIAGVEFSGERSVFWWDPIVAARVKYMPHPKIEFVLYGDFGPIRKVASYQVNVQGTYRFSKLFSTSLGFRNYFVNSEAEEKETIYTGRVYGPYLRFGFRF